MIDQTPLPFEEAAFFCVWLWLRQPTQFQPSFLTSMQLRTRFVEPAAPSTYKLSIPTKEDPMHKIVRPAIAALSIACLAGSFFVISSNDAFAQAKQAPAKQKAPAAAKQAAPPPAAEAPMKQMALTDKQIEGVLAAQTEMNAITDKIPENAKPNPKVVAQLDAIAKKNGFAGTDEYDVVVDNISMVLGGFDPQTKKYVGDEAVLRSQIAAVQADKKMPAKEKKMALDDMNAALKTPAPTIENKGNIDLVEKNYDKLSAAFSAD
jgi:hypothetical protein